MKKDKKGFFAEFKEFAFKGNMVDLAVGVVIATAFGAITSSLVNDVFMPLVGMFLGGVNFSSWTITLPALFEGAAANVINIGVFIQKIVDFLVIAFVIFMVVKAINRARRKKEKEEEAAPAAPPEPSKEEVLLTEIRDLLKEIKK